MDIVTRIKAASITRIIKPDSLSMSINGEPKEKQSFISEKSDF